MMIRALAALAASLLLIGCAGVQSASVTGDALTADGATPQSVSAATAEAVESVGSDSVVFMDIDGTRAASGQPVGTMIRGDIGDLYAGSILNQKGVTAEGVEVLMADGTQIRIESFSTDPSAAFGAAVAQREQWAEITKLNTEAQIAQAQANRDVALSIIEAAKAAATAGASELVPEITVPTPETPSEGG